MRGSSREYSACVWPDIADRAVQTVGNGESQLLLKVCQDGEATALPVDARVRMCGALGVLASRATVGDAENEVCVSFHQFLRC